MTRVNCGWRGSGSRWLMPAGCVLLGCVVLLAGWLGGQLVTGLIGLVVMAAFGLFIALAGRSETIRGLRGDGRDERFAQIDLRATGATGMVLIVAVIVAFLVEIARARRQPVHLARRAGRDRLRGRRRLPPLARLSTVESG